MELEDLNDDFISIPLEHAQIPENIPVPDQIPAPIDLHLKSSQTSHGFEPPLSNSRTIQTLMGQNQDLTARLTVSLKRNIELEQKIEQQESLFQKISTQYDLQRTQMQLFQEKLKRVDFENQKLLQNTTEQERKYNELYAAYQDKIGHIQKLSYRLHRHLNYRRRIQKIVKPFIALLKAKLTTAQSEILDFNEKIFKQNEVIQELKNRLNEAVEHIQTITAKSQKDQTELVAYHENKYQQIAAEHEALKGYAENLDAQNSSFKTTIEQLKETEVGLENKSIFFERKYSDLKNEFEQISKEFIDQKKQDAQRISQLEMQTKELSTQYSETYDAKAHLDTENKALNDQYHSLQILYQDSMNKIDELKRMNQAQDQINKELSQSLVEQRKKVEFLEQKQMETEEDFKRKLQAFQVRFHKNEPMLTTATTPVNPMGQKELLNKIQSLLSEIQTGQSDLDFQEDQSSGALKQDELISEFGDLDHKS